MEIKKVDVVVIRPRLHGPEAKGMLTEDAAALLRPLSVDTLIKQLHDYEPEALVLVRTGQTVYPLYPEHLETSQVSQFIKND